jgi:uncharacterized protein (DUF1501 family)
MILSRRVWLKLPALGALGWLLPSRAWGTELGDPALRPRSLVVVLQRGAVDGLSMVVPHDDPDYQRLRPRLAVFGQRERPPAQLRLGGGFALHPALGPLHELYQNRQLAFVHAVGSANGTRSHFDAQDDLETGTPGRRSTHDGFLNRLAESLGAAPGQTTARALCAVAVQSRLPRSLRGDEPALAFENLNDLRVRGRQFALAGRTFQEMYASAVDEALRSSASEAFDAVALASRVKERAPAPQNGANYPKSNFGRRMRQIAQLIQSDVGLQIAVTESGGWDTHTDQAKRLENGFTDHAAALRAFLDDLGDRRAEVCLVTATEFGRTVAQNGTGGTDHGHGSVMLVAGGGVAGGKVHGAWEGLAVDRLFEGRDLPVTTEHRDVFAHVLAAHWGITDLGHIFPGFVPNEYARFS